MIRFGMAVLLVALAGGLAGCEVAPKEEIQALPKMYVPSTGMTSRSMARVGGVNPYGVLPESDATDYPIARSEKFVYGTMYSQYAQFTVYTYDWQRISGPCGSGWRFRDYVQTWETAP